MKNIKRGRLVWQLLLLLLLAVGTFFIIYQHNTAPYRQTQGDIFGTSYHIIYQHEDDLQTDILSALKRVDSSLSMFNETSVLARINRNEDILPDDMFRDIFKLSQTVSEQTSGAFDVTVAPLVNLWGFGFKKGVNPTQTAIDSIRSFVGYDKVSLDKKMRKTDPRIMIDFSAIAKGYGVDVVANLLERHGVKNYMVEIGGEMVNKGVNSEGNEWRIGINRPDEDPESDSKELQAILQITDCAIATSGNYRNFYYKGGKKYAHTIDPRTGYPVQHSLLSATVVAKTCAVADAYATAFMVLGMDEAKAILKQNQDLSAYFIYTDEDGHYAIWCSPELQSKVVQ